MCICISKNFNLILIYFNYLKTPKICNKKLKDPLIYKLKLSIYSNLKKIQPLESEEVANSNICINNLTLPLFLRISF